MDLSAVDCILFDADETLFEFDGFKGLQRLFASYGVNFTADDYQVFKQLNDKLWVQYQAAEITSAQLKTQRFVVWADKLAIPEQRLNREYQQAMIDICRPLPGAEELLIALKGRYTLGIVSNGFTELLRTRLSNTGFNQYFSAVVVSEQFGIAKPDRRIFHHALHELAQQRPERTLMVGDTPESDIRGGYNAGLKTCWLDHGVWTMPQDLKPDFRINNLNQLRMLLT